MEIRKAPASSQYLTSLLRQREVAGVSAKIDAISGRLDVTPEGKGQDQASRLFDPKERRFALEALEESQASAERLAQKENPAINNRARMALGEYMAQENLVQEDARVSLRQMLGVDYYA